VGTRQERNRVAGAAEEPSLLVSYNTTHLQISATNMTLMHDTSLRDTLQDLLGPDASEPVRQAIRDGDEPTVRQASAQLTGAAILSAKIEAVEQGRPDFLKVLLQSDRAVPEDLVAIACQRKDMDSLRILLDYGWQINDPVYSAASLLWSVVLDSDLLNGC